MAPRRDFCAARPTTDLWPGPPAGGTADHSDGWVPGQHAPLLLGCGIQAAGRIIFGDADFIRNSGFARTFHELFPGSELFVITVPDTSSDGRARRGGARKAPQVSCVGFVSCWILSWRGRDH
jgi:hypothetical protein